MTKAEMVQKILDDMKAKKSPYSKEDIDKEWKGWLSRQPKAVVEEIMNNRRIK